MNEISKKILSRKLTSFENLLREEIPWYLLPDALQEYSIPRHVTHFERFDKLRTRNYSFINFPDEKILNLLSKKSVDTFVYYFLGKGYQDYTIPEKVSFFDYLVHNHYHSHHEAIGCHLVYDSEFYNILSTKMIDISSQLNNVFTIRYNGKQINKQELETQLILFDQLCFIKLAGIVFEKTGFILNRKWFKEFIFEELKKIYPSDLANVSFQKITANLNSQLNKRISLLDFELSQEEKNAIELTNNFDDILELIYKTILEKSVTYYYHY